MRKVLAVIFSVACLGLALLIDLNILWHGQKMLGLVVGVLVAPVTVLIVPIMAIHEDSNWLPLLLLLGGSIIPLAIWPRDVSKTSKKPKYKFDDTPFDLDKSA